MARTPASITVTVDAAAVTAAVRAEFDRLVERWPAAFGEGWAWPSERGVWHYFRAGDSLCGAWTLPHDAPASVFAPEALHAQDERPACRECVIRWGADA